MRTLPFLAHFQATRREVADLALEENLAGIASDLPGFVYAERFWIEREPDGTYYLPLVQAEYRSADLAELEGLLFEYATQHEGCDAEECHVVLFARGITCPNVCPICRATANGTKERT